MEKLITQTQHEYSIPFVTPQSIRADMITHPHYVLHIHKRKLFTSIIVKTTFSLYQHRNDLT